MKRRQYLGISHWICLTHPARLLWPVAFLQRTQSSETGMQQWLLFADWLLFPSTVNTAHSPIFLSLLLISYILFLILQFIFLLYMLLYNIVSCHHRTTSPIVFIWNSSIDETLQNNTNDSPGASGPVTPVLNPLVGLFGIAITNKPEGLLESKFSKRGRIEHRFVSVGSISVVFIEVKKEVSTSKARSNSGFQATPKSLVLSHDEVYLQLPCTVL